MIASQHPAIADILALARKRLSLARVFLFGSRARGDARDDSDIDLAIEHNSDDNAWASFVNEVQDSAPTLLDIDLVDLRHASPELRAVISREGVSLDG